MWSVLLILYELLHKLLREWNWLLRVYSSPLQTQSHGKIG